MKKHYLGIAEVWFTQFYKPMTLSMYLRCWWNGIDPRKSAVENFAIYIEGLHK